MRLQDRLGIHVLFFCWSFLTNVGCVVQYQDESCDDSEFPPCCSEQKNVIVYVNESTYVPDLEPLHRETRTGVTVSSIFVQMMAPFGSTTKLPCPVRQLGNRTVSWVHHVGDSVNLLTVGSMVYSNNNRLSVDYRYPGNWTLKMRNAQLEDQGCYQCQVNTHPPISVYILLRIKGPAIEIVDQRNESIQEALFKSGVVIQLKCSVRAFSGNNLALTWKHGQLVLNQDTRRGGIHIRTERWQNGAISWLLIARSTTHDSGTYSCHVNDLANATVNVHVIQGEQQAAVHDYTSAATTSLPPSWFFVIVINPFCTKLFTSLY